MSLRLLAVIAFGLVVFGGPALARSGHMPRLHGMHLSLGGHHHSGRHSHGPHLSQREREGPRA